MEQLTQVQQDRGPVRVGIGVVAIGRNEGDRLRRCLDSVRAEAQVVVYVDSGSTDGSVAMARGMGIEVVELDLDQPFTAARARNAGFARAMELAPGLEFIQFVDGDCEVVEGWLETAEQALRGDVQLAVVCGRRRERYPEASTYNRLCDMEWNTPVGEARACGGDAMMRVEALRQVGGYDPGLIAGEEPELCYRLRQRNWKVMRLNAEMTLHDAAMVRFGQWWKRAVRAGHAYAEASAMHGGTPERFRVRETRSNWFWGLIVPLLLLLSLITGFFWTPAWLGLLLLAGYPAQVGRIYMRKRREGLSGRDGLLYAFFTVLSKFPQVVGQVRFVLGRVTGRRSRVIEYKSAVPGGRGIAPADPVRSSSVARP
jgi:glycosyltransferase involved in cell wall biosynthesis